MWAEATQCRLTNHTPCVFSVMWTICSAGNILRAAFARRDAPGGRALQSASEFVMEEIGTLPGNDSGTTNTTVLMSWSGGTDSCIALYEIQRTPDYRVAALLTTLTRDYDRISMHGVRSELLEEQATSLGLPLHKVFISKDATNDEYEMRMGEAFSLHRKQGIGSIVFGDLFLEDIRTYRDQFFAGRLIDQAFLSSLPGHVDPCGENGEFHSFVFDGPIFAEAVKFGIGETVLREGFWFRDLLPQR